MKIRNGFVSNSSSSSFVVVGAAGGYVEKLWDAVGLPSMEAWEDDCSVTDEFNTGDGIFEKDGLVFAGGPCRDACRAVGISAKNALLDKSINQLRPEIQTKFTKFGVVVPLEEINLICGESSSEY